MGSPFIYLPHSFEFSGIVKPTIATLRFLVREEVRRGSESRVIATPSSGHDPGPTQSLQMFGIKQTEAASGKRLSSISGPIGWDPVAGREPCFPLVRPAPLLAPYSEAGQQRDAAVREGASGDAVVFRAMRLTCYLLPISTPPYCPWVRFQCRYTGNIPPCGVRLPIRNRFSDSIPASAPDREAPPPPGWA